MTSHIAGACTIRLTADVCSLGTRGVSGQADFVGNAGTELATYELTHSGRARAERLRPASRTATVTPTTTAARPPANQGSGSEWLDAQACSGTPGGRQQTSGTAAFGASAPASQIAYPKNQAGASFGHVTAIGTSNSAA
jgi:hypothetical protein